MRKPAICRDMVHRSTVSSSKSWSPPTPARTPSPSHKPVLGDDPVAVENRRLVAAAIEAGFTVNFSAENPAHADRQAELEIAPVVTVLGRAYARRAVRHRFKRRPDQWAETIGEWRDRTASLPRRTPAGRRIAVCPATYSDATCGTCGACARVRDPVIGFPAHGAWRQVETATAARDVALGEPWTFPETSHDGRGHRRRDNSS
jgi:hypothetical protein